MDNNRPRPLYEIGEQAISLVSNGVVEILNCRWIEKGVVSPECEDGKRKVAAKSGYYYESTRNPGFSDHECMFRKRPDLGNWEGTFFNPHKVKTPEIA